MSIFAESHSPVSAGDRRFHLHRCDLTHCQLQTNQESMAYESVGRACASQHLERILFHFRSPDHAIDDSDMFGVMLFVMQSQCLPRKPAQFGMHIVHFASASVANTESSFSIARLARSSVARPAQTTVVQAPRSRRAKASIPLAPHFPLASPNQQYSVRSANPTCLPPCVYYKSMSVPWIC